MAGQGPGAAAPKASSMFLVIGASSLGTVFEWFDFFVFATLAPVISTKFFEVEGINSTTAFIFALLAFAAGFIVRPLGAFIFGHVGDRVGRKTTFLLTMIIMGLSTFAVGLLPDYKHIGMAAPSILIGLRLLQGLALGGEYGGAATYVAEHSPHNRRGLMTSWIQTTATFGLLLSLVLISVTRTNLGEDVFKDWGWRVPFLSSIVLLLVSVWIRMQLNESPVFQAMKDEGTLSKAPFAEAFLQWKNLKIVLLALFGLVAGQGVVWYAGQFYALFFLQNLLHVEANTAYFLIGGALVIATPFFLIFGWLSDMWGRKPIILAGLLLACVGYIPLFHALTDAVNPALGKAQATAPVTVVADPAACALQFDPVGKAKFLQSCDIAKSALAKGGISYGNTAAPAGTVASIHVGQTVVESYEGAKLTGDAAKAAAGDFKKRLGAALKAAGYPEKADTKAIDTPKTLAILTLLVILVTMVYAPMAAALVELFPARIRYSAMSAPYHFGNGWFGGLLPFIAFTIIATTGGIYDGLWYPIIIAGITFVIGFFFYKEKKTDD
ncbi:MFS transporter [Asticcacaulis solisilvae]|uniref:MFS transporter n=1 Tax=Asticcacaulis solisilvae TaxID=1217274 RepID=UPI003FD712AB